MEKQAQLERIVWKLKMAARRDTDLKEFGANRHGYRMNEPIGAEEIANFEAETGIVLPIEFVEFLQIVGSGGAGPYYGIAPLGTSLTMGSPNLPCSLSPGMTQREWSEKTAFLDDPLLEKTVKEELQNELYGGLLGIGTMGWTFEMMLVVTGPYRGRIVYVDRSHQIPFFTYEANFLEWYERWLDEIIGGYDKGWFAMERAEDEVVLADLYLSSLEERVKVSTIQGMHKLPKLKLKTAEFLVEQCMDESAAVRLAALEILAQKDYASAVPFLKKALDSSLVEERLNAVRQVDAHGEPGGGELTAALTGLLPGEEDHRVLCQAARILEQSPFNPLHLLVSFFAFPDRDMRREAIFHAGRLPGREAYASEFGRALDDEDEIVRKTAVGALVGLPIPELLPKYGQLLDEAKKDPEYRREVLRRLAEYGSEAGELLGRLVHDGDPQIRREARHLLGRLKTEMNPS